MADTQVKYLEEAKRQEVINEHKELAAKTDAMRKFCLSPEYHGNTIAPREQTRLRSQFEAMKIYQSILEERLAEWPKDNRVDNRVAK